MKNLLKFFAMFLMATSFVACNEEDVIIASVEPDKSIYVSQTYFSLANNKEVSVIQNSTWDIAFGNGVSNREILLNNANNLSVYETTSSDINTLVQVPTDAKWIYNSPTGDLTKMPFNNWVDNRVYVVAKMVFNLGQLSSTPKYVLSISKVSDSFVVKIANYNSVNFSTINISNNLSEYTLFSLDTKSVVTNKLPSKSEYDLLFTGYIDMVTAYGQTAPYGVQGVLLGDGVSAYLNQSDIADASKVPYENIKLSDVDASKFNLNKNVIGWDWKQTNQGSPYVTNTYRTYFVKTKNNQIFKLRFKDFYNDDLVKGYIKFEFTELK